MALGGSRCGIAYRSTGAGYESYLPLQKLEAHAEVIEASAIITLTQTFFSSVAIREARPYARYEFPLPDKAVVCDFEMRHAARQKDFVAVVQEKEKAKATFTKAYNTKVAAGLVEHVSDNVFSISLGNLPGSMVVSTKLTYVTDLSNADYQDQLRLHLPVCFGTYNGSGLGQTIPSNRISITVNIHMKGPIESITSPSHPYLITTFASSPLEQLPAYEFEPKCTTSYRSPDFLSTDFILFITCPTLSRPLCVAERHPSGSVAFRLSVVPQLKLPPIARQEYIFMLDRSASMYGTRIETAKKTLVLLLHALPSSGTMFNIFSFGSWHSSLWSESREYTQDSLDEACEHVDEMIANHGGTDICDVLRAACASRNRNLPTACFLLTDGEVLDDPWRTLSTVMRQVERSTVLQPLRVFTLGIGAQASVSMCDAIADAGNGISLMASATEDMVAKCARLVRLSRSPVCEVSVNWKQPSPRRRPIFEWCRRKLAMQVQSGEVQSPMDGVQLTQYALVKKKGYVVPKEVVLSVRVIGKDETTNVVVPVEPLPYNDSKTSRSRGQFHLIHALAVDSIIRRLEDEDEGLERNKKRILALAKKYQLITKYTSLVAVDKDQKTQRHATLSTAADDPNVRAFRMMPSLGLPSLSFRRQTGNHTTRTRRATSSWSSALVPKRESKSKDDNSLVASGSNPQSPVQTESKRFQEEYSADPTFYYQEEYGSMSSPKSARRKAFVEGPSSHVPAVVHHTDGHEDVYDPTIECSPQEDYSYRPEHRGSPSGQTSVLYMAKGAGESTLDSKPDRIGSIWKSSMKNMKGSRALRFLSTSTNSSNASSSPFDSELDGIDANTMQLIRLQAFDGSFAFSSELEKIIGRTLLYDERCRFETEKSLWVTEDVWATVLATAYLQKHLVRQKDLLTALSEKATGYLHRNGDVSIAILLERASELVELL